jgi:hypothetical protein
VVSVIKQRILHHLPYEDRLQTHEILLGYVDTVTKSLKNKMTKIV